MDWHALILFIFLPSFLGHQQDVFILLNDENEGIKQMAIHLSLLGGIRGQERCYGYAGDCYDHLASIGYGDKAVLNNNAGVNKTLEGIHYFMPDELSFVLPFELDVMETGAGLRSDNKNNERKIGLLINARENFLKAIEYNDKYAVAYLNLSGILALLNDTDAALDYAFKAISLVEEEGGSLTTKARAHVMLSYTYYKIGNKERALYHLDEAEKLGDDKLEDYIQVNRKVINGQPSFPVRFDLELFCLQNETIDNHNAETIANNFAQTGSNMVTLNSGTAYFYLKNEPTSRQLFFEKGNDQITILQTSDHYQEKTCKDITINSHQGDVQKKYATPTIKRATKNGQYWVYNESNLAFLILNKSVKGWVIYYLDLNH